MFYPVAFFGNVLASNLLYVTLKKNNRSVNFLNEA